MTEVEENDKIINKIIDLSKDYNLGACADYLKEFSSGNGRNENSKVLIQSFLEIFPGLSEEFLYQISIASNFYFWSILITDKILDEKTDKLNKEALLLSYVLRERSLGIMYHLFPPTNKFWQYFDKYYKEYTNALIQEENYHFNKFTRYSIDELEMIYNGHSSFAKAVPIAFAFQSNKEVTFASIEDSIKYFYIALNIKDDVNDWKKDYINGQYTYLLTKVVMDNHLEDQLKEMNINDIGKQVFFSGVANETLELSLGYFQKALDSVEDIDCPSWKNFVRNNMDGCVKFSADIRMLVQKQLTIAGVLKNEEIEKDIPKFDLILPEPKNSWGKILNYTLDYIHQQWKLGFLEATNHKYFPENFAALGLTERYYLSNVFERAVISEILIDISKDLNNILQPMIDHEIKFLINSRVSDNEGWSFYLNCPVLASDADTTSQVIEVLLKSQKKELVDQFGKTPIDTLLKYQSRPDGSVGTWILSNGESCDEKETMKRKFHAEFIKLVSDKNADTEVVANLLYALFLYDKNKYKEVISKGITYLENCQHEKGFWESTWYYGPYYGIYVSLRILKELNPKSPALLKGNDFIISTQNDDGGWGADHQKSDPLNTAFSLICLSYLKNIGMGDYTPHVGKALHYLLSSISDDHCWPSVNFINPNSPKTPYKSRTLTNVYISKAASLWNLN